MTPDDLDAIRARDAAGQPLREFDSFERAVAALRAFVEETTEDRRALLAEVDRLRAERDIRLGEVYEAGEKGERARIEKAVEGLAGWRDPRYSGMYESPGLVDRAAVLAAIEGEEA